MTITETAPETSTERDVVRPRASVVEELLGSGDHTIIGRTYVVLAALMGVVYLSMVAIANIDRGIDSEILDPTAVTRFELNTPFGLLLSVALPLFLGLAICVVPLQVGAPSVAFPRAAALSLWGWLLGSVFLLVATIFRGSFGGSSVDLGRLGLLSLGLMSVALLLGAVCVVVTVLSLRVPGQSIAYVPHFSFSMLVAGSLWMLTLPVAIARIILLHVQHPQPSDLLEAYPSMTWLFHQPAIFVAIIPALGIVADSFSAMTGRPIRFYGVVQGAIGAAGLLSFGAWAQSLESRETFIWVGFGLAIALPVAAVFLASAESLRHGRPTLASPFVFALGATAMALLAALVSFVLAGNTLGDTTLFDVTVGELGLEAGLAYGLFYLVIGAAILAGLGGSVLWASRIWPSAMEEKLALPVAIIAPLGVVLLAGAHLAIGFFQPDLAAVEALSIVAAVGAAILALCALDGVILAAMTGRRSATEDGSTSGDDGGSDSGSGSTWSGGSLEWAAAAPPVPGNFVGELPAVDGPYPLFASDEKGDS